MWPFDWFRPPPRPEGVRLITPDVSLPLDAEYMGKANGQHIWRAVLTDEEINLVHQGAARLQIEVLPGKTTVIVEG